MKWLLFLICALLPTYQLRFQVFGLPTTFLEVMILILFLVWLIKFKKFKAPNSIFHILPSIYWFWLILAWLVVGLIGVFISPDKWGALGHWRAYFLEPILLLIVFLDLTRRDANQRIHTNDTNIESTAKNYSTIRANTGNSYLLGSLVLIGLGVSALICSFWTIYQKIIGQGMASLEAWQYPLKLITRPTGPFPHSNFLGLFLGPIVILAIGKLIENWKLSRPKSGSASGGKIENWRRLLVISYWLLVIMASILAIIFARSEGAMLGVIAGLIFLLLLYLKKRPCLIFVTILLLFGVFLLFFSPWQKTIWQKITFQDLSLQLRLNIWRSTWQMIKEHPFFGAGLRGYQKLIANYQQPFVLPGVEGIISNEFHPYPHNLFLTIWSELGIFGLVVFLLIIFQFFKFGFRKIIQTVRTYPNTPNKVYSLKFIVYSLLAAMIVILVHGCVDTPYFKNDLAIIFWLIIGLLIIHRHQD